MHEPGLESMPAAPSESAPPVQPASTTEQPPNTSASTTEQPPNTPDSTPQQPPNTSAQPAGTRPLPPIRAALDKAPADVAGMFDTVAPRYDLLNDVLSLGQVRLWRRATREALAPRPGQLILDIGAGTGTSSVDLARSGARVLAADFSLGMLRQGRAQYPAQPFAAADAMRLPFPDRCFDAVTMSYALRNVADTEAALREFRRVTKPGGRVVVAEFSHPVNPVFRTAYSGYLMQYLPRVAGRLGSNGPSYQYLAESIRDWPDQAALARTFQRAGWRGVAWRNLSGGIVAVHRGWAD